MTSIHNTVSIVPNHRSLYIVDPFTNDENELELEMFPIIAWRIEHSDRIGESYCEPQPITSSASVNDNFDRFNLSPIYDLETDDWHIGDSYTGNGKESLLELLKVRREENRRR